MKLTGRLFILLSLALAASRMPAQVAGPSPLVDDQATAQLVPGGWIVAEGRANAALQAGFPATAAAGYRELLRDPALPTGTKQRVTLAWVTALLEAGELGAAENALQNYDGPRNTSFQLRAGLIAATGRRNAQAKAALAAGKADDLPAAERGWWFFLQATVADADGEIVPANNLYEQALRAAVSDLQRARFVLGQEQSRLRSGQVNEAQLATLRGNMERLKVKTFLELPHRVIDGAGHATAQLARPLESLAMYLEDPAPRILPHAAQADEPLRIAVHPGSGSRGKTWALEHWQRIGHALQKHHPQARLTLITGEAEDERGITAQLLAAWSNLPHEHWQSLPLPQLAKQLSACHAFLGHDSGISHLAAACGVPSHVFFGPTDPATWQPLGPRVQVCQAQAGSLAALDWAAGWHSMAAFLQELTTRAE